MNPLKWWEDSVDELVIGVAVAAIAIFALIYIGSEGTAVATTAIGALGVYLGGKTKTNGK